MIGFVLDFAVRYRWVVVLLCLIASVFGAWSLTRLPIDAVPDITNNQVQVNTTAPALSPVEIEKQVTQQIEIAIAGIPGLDYTRSLSRNGFSQVTAVFSDSTNIYLARQLLNERLLHARSTLPPGVEPRMGPITTGLGEIYMWTVNFSSPNGAGGQSGGWQPDGTFRTPEGDILRTEIEKAAYLRTVQDWIVRPQISSVRGVAGVDAIGGYVKQYQVMPDPARLVGLGLSFAELTRAIESGNASRGAGTIERNGEGYVVRTGGRVETLEDILQIPVTTRGGVPIRVRDVAEVSIGGEIRTGSASTNGRETVVGTALMLIGANSRTVAAAVDARINEIRATLPPGIEITTVLNRTQLVEATIKTVGTNLAEGAALVIIVLFLLLGNFRAALISALVIPVAMMMTAAGMLQGHVSANLMSLGALDFGLIVDGAVIVSENCLRHLAERQREAQRPLTLEERLKTVRTAAREMIAPSVYGQAIIILVYVPLLAFGGVEGKMFEPMALTVMMALAAAFILSLTFVPAMIAIFVTAPVHEGDNRLIRTFKGWYARPLATVIRRPLPVIGVAAILFSLSLLLFARLGQEFIPTLNERNVAVHAIRIASTGLSQSQAMQLQVEQVLTKFPQVELVFSKTGTAEMASDPMPPNLSDTFVILKPSDLWPDPSFTKAALIQNMETALNQLPGNNYEFTQPIQMRFNELLAGVRGDVAVKIFGDDFDRLQRAADQVAAVLRRLPGAVDVKVEQVSGLPVVDINVDKAAIARRGLSLVAVQDIIGTAIGGREAGAVFEGDRHFNIVVRLPEVQRADIDFLRNLPVALPLTGASTVSIPLHEVATFTVSEGRNQISRENGKRRIVVSANVRGRDVASLVSDARQQITENVRLPTGAWIAWGGQYENLASARQRLAVVVPACFVLIFLLLVGALRSARDAALVFSAIPLALTGGILALWLRGLPFSISAAVGFIALSGVAVLNGLVMLTFIKQLVAEGHAPTDAIRLGAMTRLRPVLMTALVASLGFVPMALATSTGAELQRPLATVVIGGLFSATLLTLLVLPALYARFGKPALFRHDDDVSASRGAEPAVRE